MSLERRFGAFTGRNNNLFLQHIRHISGSKDTGYTGLIVIIDFYFTELILFNVRGKARIGYKTDL